MLDTHVLWWAVQGEESLGRGSRKLIDAALAGEELAASAISFWELAMLAARRRIELAVDLVTWRVDVLRLGIDEIAVSGEIAIAAARLERLHGDPADRLIVATALVVGAQLVTADQRILRWRSPLRRHDARR
ncbi:MAG TPA: type II toxin-antitoxin system VapC family toxin [Thermoanaerobaculia bacterium]|nr:type II toxin-antitoxin system VapC family toxin [Thermoanaerobaculia bacterium]